MPRTFGIDVSHWEGDIDWQIVADIVNFAIMKATDGTSFVDPKYIINKQGCQDNLLSWGAYHFFHPGQDPIAQAQHFVSTVGSGCNIYVCDVETTTLQIIYGEEQLKSHRGQANLQKVADINTLLGIADPNTIGDQVKLFLEEVASLTGETPVIYTSPGFWNANIGDVPWAQNYPLWVAHWTEDPEPILPEGWDTWTLWQMTDSASIPGVPGGVDGDWYNGKLEDVYAFFGNGPGPIQSISIKITTGYLRAAPILDKPQVEGQGRGAVVGYALPPSIWNATNRLKGFDGRYYYQVGETQYIPSLMCTEV
jgi:lysozyme